MSSRRLLMVVLVGAAGCTGAGAADFADSADQLRGAGVRRLPAGDAVSALPAAMEAEALNSDEWVVYGCPDGASYAPRPGATYLAPPPPAGWRENGSRSINSIRVFGGPGSYELLCEQAFMANGNAPAPGQIPDQITVQLSAIVHASVCAPVTGPLLFVCQN